MKNPQIVNSAIDGIPEITLRGMLDEYEGGSISGFFDGCASPKARMNINCMGGSVNAGKEIIASMQAYKNGGGIIETINRGIAYSAAGWIFAAGSKGYRKMMPFATIVTHPPMFSDGSKIEDYQPGSEKHTALMESLDELVDIFTAITKKTKNFIKKVMLNTTKFNAKKAIKEGFADEIIEITNTVNLKEDLEPELIMNICDGVKYDIINKSKKSKLNMKSVAVLLNLNPEASEEAIKDAVEKIINRAETAETELSQKAVALEQKDAELTDIKNQLSEVKDAEIVNYVEKYVGDIKERKEKKDELLNMAKSDFDTFKTICPLEKTPIVNSGAQIDNGIKPEGKQDEEPGLIEARKFFNMSLSEREKLKKENISEYNKLVNAYDKHSTEII